MKLCFLGDSHAPLHLRQAACDKGFEIVSQDTADLIFVSQDTQTDQDGNRDTTRIREMVNLEWGRAQPVIVTSQIAPGFMRNLVHMSRRNIFHQSETLRIKDASHRAAHPEMFIVGCVDEQEPLPAAYIDYLQAFECPVLKMSYESAEFAKMAINAFLISQVETTNTLARLARKCGAKWEDVRDALQHDSRIGAEAYLTPGRWQDSIHLKRDFVTLCEIAGAQPKRLLEAWA